MLMPFVSMGPKEHSAGLAIFFSEKAISMIAVADAQRPSPIAARFEHQLFSWYWSNDSFSYSMCNLMAARVHFVAVGLRCEKGIGIAVL